MPKGKTHDTIAIYSLIPTFLAGTILFNNIYCGLLLTVSTLFSALFLSPDIDTQSSVYYRWHILRFIWLPYQKLIPHRSFLSHSFLIGPVIRFMYILLWIIFISSITACLLLFKDSHLILDNIYIFMTFLIKKHFDCLLAIVIGYFWANFQHLALDHTYSLFKKL